MALVAAGIRSRGLVYSDLTVRAVPLVKAQIKTEMKGIENNDISCEKGEKAWRRTASQKLKLPQVTLAAMTSVNVRATIKAMQYSMRGIDFWRCGSDHASKTCFVAQVHSLQLHGQVKGHRRL